MKCGNMGDKGSSPSLSTFGNITVWERRIREAALALDQSAEDSAFTGSLTPLLGFFSFELFFMSFCVPSFKKLCQRVKLNK